MIGYQLVTIEEEALPVILYVRSRKFKPLIYGVFGNRRGIFIQKCDKKFRQIREQLTDEVFNDNFCSI